MDVAHKETDAVLTKIEKRLRKEYKQATKEIEKKLDDYFAAFRRKDENKRQLVKDGTITQKEYNDWRYGQMCVGKRWEDMRDKLATELSRVDAIARNISDGYMPEVYAINHNFATYQIETGAKINTSYTLYDAQSVERLVRDNPQILPQIGRTTQELIDKGILKKWNMKNIQSTAIQGILQGESITKLAKRMAADVGAMNYKDCVRHARTMTTATQNAGRVDGFKRAKGMGIDVMQEWVATLDMRTRHAHRQLDGQRRPVGEPFEVDGYELQYPADPAAPYYLTMNCRCTLIGQIKGFERDARAYRQDPSIGGMTYEEWKNAKAPKKGNGAQPAAPIPAAPIPAAPVQPEFVFEPAQTIEEAEEYAKRFVKEKTWSGDGNISYKGLSVEVANKVNETLTRVFDQYDLPPLRNLEPMNFRKKEFKDAKDAPFCYRGGFAGDLFFNPNIVKTQKAIDAYIKNGQDAFEYCKNNIEKFTGAKRELIETYIKAGRGLIAETSDDPLKAMIEHELGHHVQHQIIFKDKEYVQIIKDGKDIYGIKISGYATQSNGEYIAESFSAFNNGFADLIDPKLAKIFERIRRNG